MMALQKKIYIYISTQTLNLKTFLQYNICLIQVIYFLLTNYYALSLSGRRGVIPFELELEDDADDPDEADEGY